ncbi:MAG: helix-turn-helix domain-containing protein [Proteobacteria bacterium]|nr:helix-turn-helix domain-containing protein [Pseudomonadota bacterium]
MLKLRMVDRNILDHYTDLPVGEILRRARLQYEMEIAHVSARLNIRPEHLTAIEAGDISRLPGRVYAVGFVRSYANFLQLDSDKVVYLFKSQVIGHTENRDLHFPVPVQETRHPAWWMVAASVGTLAIIGALFIFLGREAKEPAAEPELPAAISELKTENDKASEKTEAVTVKANGKLKVTALEASWVEIKAGDGSEDVIVSRVLKKGESFTAPDMDNLILSTGNADGVKVYWNDKEVDVFEGREGIVRELPISALTAFKTKVAQ